MLSPNRYVALCLFGCPRRSTITCLNIFGIVGCYLLCTMDGCLSFMLNSLPKPDIQPSITTDHRASCHPTLGKPFGPHLFEHLGFFEQLHLQIRAMLALVQCVNVNTDINIRNIHILHNASADFCARFYVLTRSTLAAGVQCLQYHRGTTTM